MDCHRWIYFLAISAAVASYAYTLRDRPKKRRLLVLDLNGTLVHRQYKHAKKKPCLREPDFVIGNFDCYKRPGIETFLDFCFQNFDVGVWTSATARNAFPLLKVLFDDRADDLKFVYTREDCIDVKNTDTDHSSTKDMSLVWKNFPEYSKQDTIVIEDSTDKHVPNTDIVMVIKPYDGTDDDDAELAVMEAKLRLLL